MKKVVFTNGAFDLFHFGHLNFLKRAAALGDRLLVGVASDESCKENKRPPFQTWDVRASRVLSLPFVNEVIKTPWSKDLTEEFYREHNIAIQAQGDRGSGFDTAERLGILRILGRTEGISTTQLLEIIKSTDSMTLEGGYVNDVKRIYFEGSYYVIKCGKRAKGKLYDFAVPASRIADEYEAILAFREALGNPPFIVNPITFDSQYYFIIFEGAPLHARKLSDCLMEGNACQGLLKPIASALAKMHNATLDVNRLRERFGKAAGFLDVKIGIQCRNVTRDANLARDIDAFIDKSLQIKRVLLHGDAAPKNILVWDNQFLLLDFEESGYGDPALDMGYLCAHFLIHQVMTGKDEFGEAIRVLHDTYLGEIACADECLANRMSKYAGIFVMSRVDGMANFGFIPESAKSALRETSRCLFYGERRLIN